jgi:hypothetical protein
MNNTKNKDGGQWIMMRRWVTIKNQYTTIKQGDDGK